MLAKAYEKAIAKHGGETMSTRTSGSITKSKNSNAYRAARHAKFTDFEVYAGARAGRNWNDGYELLIVDNSCPLKAIALEGR